MSADWTEKYRPQTLSDVVGNPKAVSELQLWAGQWKSGTPKFRAAVLMGSPGIGKTTSAEALARDMGWDILEMNASDQRTGDDIRTVALMGSGSNTFGDDGEYLSVSEGKRKLIVLDEADSLFGNADRGAMPAITELIRKTLQPVLLIVNDFYELSRKSSVIKNETMQISFQRPASPSILKALRRVCASEGIDADDAALKAVADNSNGDLRAAVRDLQSLCLGRTKLTYDDTTELSNRIVRKSIYDLMFATFRKSSPIAARKLMNDVDEEPGTVLLWVDENLPREYRDVGDLVRGYEKLSRADIFMGRVRRRQYYGMWSYAGDMMTAGVASARWSNTIGRERFMFPSYLSKMSRSKGIRASKAALCQKIADYTHSSAKRIANEFLDQLKLMFANDEQFRIALTHDAGLDADDISFLTGKKADSKEIKALLAQAEEYVPKKAAVVVSADDKDFWKEPVKIVPTVREEAPKKEPEPPKEKPKAAPKPAGQMSLFDF